VPGYTRTRVTHGSDRDLLVSSSYRLNVAVAAADEAITYGQFKRVASEAVRVADMRVVVSEERRTRQSTLVRYLQLIGPIPEGSMFPNECT
jgi:hypothetical protein